MACKNIIRVITVFLAVLFLYAAIVQLEDYRNFRLQVQKFPFISFLNEIVWIVPVTEFAIASLLLLPATRVMALFSSLFLLSGCTVYLATMLNEQYSQSCRCGEPLYFLSLRTHIIFNLAAVLVTGVGVVLSGKVTEPLPAVVYRATLPKGRKKEIIRPKKRKQKETSEIYPN